MKAKNLPIIALVGLPNSGKSTLFNRLTHSSHAIISEIPHTTRDTNRGVAKIDGRAFEIVDTAGYTNQKGQIYQSAMSQLSDTLSKAEVIVYVIDGTVDASAGDDTLAKMIHLLKKSVVLAINKADNSFSALPAEKFRRLGFEAIVFISAIHSIGINDLNEILLKNAPKKGTYTSVDNDEIMVAILGRPNVGKSSLLNALAGETLAIEADEAGTTRDTNEFSLQFHGTQITFIDTAGLRKPGKISKAENIEFYSKVRTKRAIERADICLMLIDANEPATAQDLHMAGMVKDARCGLIVVGTKWDTVEKDTHTMASITEFIRSKLQFVWWAPLVFTSAKTRQNLDDLLALIKDVNSRLDFSLSTPKLNRFLEDANAKNPPAAVKTKKPKVNYITQTGQHPPKFTIFATHPEYMHWSYTRFLENQLRDQFDLNGVPITIEYQSKYKEGKRRTKEDWKK
ncbi:ribosome biogenesis GTPase Der [Candidatus Saccharibacteria bacterium]|nr:ribosome biogenesis GTPase Der [Candidatus Saccharibacteria bacterium]